MVSSKYEGYYKQYRIYNNWDRACQKVCGTHHYPSYFFAFNGLFLRVGRYLKADESSDIKKRNTRSNHRSSNNSHGIYGLEGHENPASGSNDIGRPLKAKFLFLFNKFLKSRMVLYTMSRYGGRGLPRIEIC